MTQKNDLLKSTANAEKTFNRVLFALLIVTILLVVCYETIGTSMIKAAYEGKSLRVLNEAIEYQYKKPVEHYLYLADTFFYRSLFIGLIALGYACIIIRLTFFKNALKLIWIIIWGVFVLSGFYWVCPYFRIFSSHGLMHSNIVYEILHGNIPPQNPLLGGEPLLWPWGYHYLAAMVSRLFNITPTWSFAAINVVSYILAAYLIFKISELLMKNPRANNLSVLMAIFCSTCIAITDHYWLREHFNLYIDIRIAPLAYKFIHSSGVPIGFMLYMLFVYALLRIFTDNKKWKLALPLLLVSVVGVGFFYFQMFAGVLGSFALFFAVKVFQYIRDKNSENLRKIVLASVTVCLGILVILPYALSLTVHAKGKIVLLDPVFVWQDFTSILLTSVPLLIIILANHKNLKKLNSQSAISLVSLLAGTILSFICVRFPSSNDYKFAIQSVAVLGIFGGIFLSFMCVKRKRIWVVIAMLILIRPIFSYVDSLTTRPWPSVPVETDTRFVATGEKAELYEWILNNTSRDDQFIDTKLNVPCFGQRQLFVAIDEYHDNQIVIMPGYSLPIYLLFTDTSGYSFELLEYRYRMLRKIYDPEVPLDDEELRDLLSKNDNLLIVVRQTELQDKFDNKNFKRVFLSSENNFAVFKYTESFSEQR